MLKRIIVMGVALIMSLGLFAGCVNDNNKIDIGGEITSGKPLPSVRVRVLMDNDIFCQDDNVKIKVGFGFVNGQRISAFIAEGAVVVVKIEGTGIIITDENDVEYNDEYEREFKEYLDDKFVCTLDNKRYIPNYYETFKLKLSSGSTSGAIQVSAVKHVDGEGDGQTLRLFYVANSNKISFSVKSKADAQKKLK